MKRKLLAVLVGLLIAGLLTGTAFAGNEGPIDLKTCVQGVYWLK